MEMNNILQFIDKYGWTGIVVVFFGLLVIYGFKYVIARINSNIHKDFDSMVTQITTSVNTTNKTLLDSIMATQKQMLDFIINSEQDAKEKHSTSIETRLDIGHKLITKVKDINNKYHCDRACIIELHNSKENLNGLSFVWYDIQYEWQKKNVDAISGSCKNVQASTLIPVIEDLKHSENNYIIWNEPELEELYNRSSVLHNYLIDKLHVKGMVYLGLFNEDNKLTGLLALEYSTHIPDDLLDMVDLTDEAGNISTLLQLK